MYVGNIVVITVIQVSCILYTNIIYSHSVALKDLKDRLFHLMTSADMVALLVAFHSF